ncbi:hypothetical protein GCK72_012221 [Caenorhabditis remanei]|uniref:Uncharacterized protein n=1 Tax=Caenorhabditis remanei TaxID=31234 RepID=A0A6A5GM93_CAERE|nr:hypothetical protein GCK72_012221 [Caenorhabditis remanei]KAF1755771.1 hypothetical protein GCK72_012221 [Caenorhabditis remanei]
MKLQLFLLLVFVAIGVASMNIQDLKTAIQQEIAEIASGIQDLKDAIELEVEGRNIRDVVNASEIEDQIETYTGLRVGILEDEISKLRELIKKLQSETAF